MSIYQRTWEAGVYNPKVGVDVVLNEDQLRKLVTSDGSGVRGGFLCMRRGDKARRSTPIDFLVDDTKTGALVEIRPLGGALGEAPQYLAVVSREGIGQLSRCGTVIANCLKGNVPFSISLGGYEEGMSDSSATRAVIV